MAADHKECSTCFFTTEFPGIEIGEDGRCNVCRSGERPKNPTPEGLRLEELRRKIDELNKDATSDYDCIVGASGGLDSSYVLYVAKKLLGLNPLVLNYDSGFVHERATENLRTMCERLGVEVRTIRSRAGHDRRYIRAMVRAVRGTGLYWGVCRFCHFILTAVVCRQAADEGIVVALSSNNVYEGNLHMRRDYKREFMKRALLENGPGVLLRFLFYSLVAGYHLFRLRLEFYVPPLKNLLRTAPAITSLTRVNITRYVPWDIDEMVRTLGEEVGWRPPEGTKLPMRFDCLIEDGLMNRTYKSVGGLTIHAIISNNMIYGGLRTKEDLAEDVANYDDAIEPCIREVEGRLGIT